MATINPHLEGLHGSGSSKARVESTPSATSPSQFASFESGSSPATQSPLPQPPSFSLPKGGGAIRGMGEKLDVSPSTGAGSAVVPIHVSNSRGNLQPKMSLSYSSGAGNGPFGLGWQLSLLQITRKTDKGLPRYDDVGVAINTDVYLLADSEDLVPLLQRDVKGGVVLDSDGNPVYEERTIGNYIVRRYSPRIEASFTRIERWANTADMNDIHWRTISPGNHTTIFGPEASSRIYDPSPKPGEPLRIFAWLIAETYDDQGNAMKYNYRAEDSANIPVQQSNEANRTDISRSANKYLMSIQYGNRTPNRQMGTWQPISAFELPDATWMFSVVFDYGDHDWERPKYERDRPWACRKDPFSRYAAGFEIRTYRLCQRILMFHHFKELNIPDCLVSSTEINYSYNPAASYLVSAVQASYVWDDRAKSYTRKATPPLEFEYSLFPTDEELSQLTVQEIDAESLENLPIGSARSRYEWVDLDGEGLSGLLTEQDQVWYYKRNTSANNFPQAGPVGEDVSSSSSPSLEGAAQPRFGALERISRPSLSLIDGQARFGDVSGAGRLDLINMQEGSWGYYERTENGEWISYETFQAFPNLDLKDPNVKFVDLTGDGLADILVYSEQVFTWFPSLGADGYGEGQSVTQPADENSGPTCVFSDSEETIYLADISGDGLADLVRIRNGDVCYWPSLGYCRFGAAVQMDNGPWFDCVDQFNEKRVVLADVDGSGTTDILYLTSDGVDIYLNQSGNGFSGRKSLNFLPIDDQSSIRAVDLLGNGTTCLVWSTDLPHQYPSMRYVDLTRGKKPHLLTRSVNNLGAESRLYYAPSTKFYLQDKAKGTPWLTSLPFPVQCVEKYEVFDHISGNRFVTQFSYHHGYFDGYEREFRGFARTEAWDTETFTSVNDKATNLDSSLHVPPTHTKTWFHCGSYLENEKLRQQLALEYFGAPTSMDKNALDEFYKSLLGFPIMPEGDIGADELRESYRALKGMAIRVESYADDGSSKAHLPYNIIESNYIVRCLQPLQDKNRHSIYTVAPFESITHHYERNIEDPRVQHSIALDLNYYGQVQKSISIGYGRRSGQSSLNAVDKFKQETTMFVYSETDFTNDVIADDVYRMRLPYESRQYELSGFVLPAGADRFSPSDFSRNDFAPISSLLEVPYEQVNDPMTKKKRLLGRSITVYRSDDLERLLPFGILESRGIPGTSYTLCFTPGLLQKLFIRQIPGQSPENLLPNPKDVLQGTGDQQGGYVDLENNGHYWKKGGKVSFHIDPTASPSAELVEAKGHFFKPRCFTDAFGNNSFVDYDENILFPVVQRDALGNTASLVMDYRVLAPGMITNINGNRSAVAFDTLGMVCASAIMGKVSENLGDSFDNFDADISQENLDEFFANPRGQIAERILGTATMRTVYDVGRYYRDPDRKLPAYSAVISRESHSKDPVSADGLKLQIAFSFSDGFSRMIQSKVPAKPGPVEDGGPIVSPRWTGTGWTVYNNKGKPVKQYEPFFDDTHDFKDNAINGVTSIIFYDPLGRAVATLHPDHTVDKVVFDPWSQTVYDANDNVLLSDPRSDPDIGHFFDSLPLDAFMPSWYDQRISGQQGSDERQAAVQTAAHAATPSMTHLDALGRTILAVGDNGPDGFVYSRQTLDIQGHQLETIDSYDRVVARNAFDMIGTALYYSSMDAGERWVLPDALGNALFAWNSRGYRYRTSYDVLRRPTKLFLQDSTGAEVMVEQTTYGDTLVDAEKNNVRGKVVVIRDQAGISTTYAYDFKDNALSSGRQLATEYKKTLDCSTEIPLDEHIFRSDCSFDALNRPMVIVAPDKSKILHVYNETGKLEQVFANVRGEQSSDQSTWTPFLTGVEYDAKGRSILVKYGNGATIKNAFDKLTSNLRNFQTTRESSAGQGPLQDLRYTYDATGNMTHITDKALPTVYFRNTVVDGSNDYKYDPLYRLIQATGREHLGQGGTPTPFSSTDSSNVGLSAPGDGTAMARYTESYVYDKSNNLLVLKHAGSDASKPGWTRTFSYNEKSIISPGGSAVPGVLSNRLSSSTVGGITENYKYEGNAGIHGNMTSMPHLSQVSWDYLDQMRSSSRQVIRNEGTPETTYYVYDTSGQRVRKVTERQSTGPTATVMKERCYIGIFEVYREYAGDGTTVTLERESLEVNSESSRIALVETRTQGDTTAGPARLIRYHFGNALDSAVLELNESAQILSYEEYTPYGSTSYQAVRSQTETPKRYRFGCKERDEENGLYYHGARYYAPWLAKWTSADPAGLVDGMNVYCYVSCRPTQSSDPSGTEGGGGPDDFPIEGKRADIRVSTTDKLVIDELDAVGAKFKGWDQTPVSKSEQMDRARSADNRVIREGYDNTRKREFSLVGNRPPPRPQVSVVKDPNALLDRRFSEVEELNAVFEEAKASVKNWASLEPGVVKKRINEQVWEIIRNGKSDAAVKIRNAMAIIGIVDSPTGFRLAQKGVTRPPPEKLYSEEPTTSTAAPESTTPAPAAPAEPVAPEAAATPAAPEPVESGKLSINAPEEPGVSAPGKSRSVGSKIGMSVAVAEGAADIVNKLEEGDGAGALASGAKTAGGIALSELIPGFGEGVMIFSIHRADTEQNKQEATAAGMKVLQAYGVRTDVVGTDEASLRVWGEASDAYLKTRVKGAVYGGLIQPMVSTFSRAGRTIYHHLTHPTTYGIPGL